MTEKGRYARKVKGDGEKLTEPGKPNVKAQWKGFVNFTPSEPQKERFVQWLSEVNYYDALDEQAAKGRKISVGYSPNDGCYLATCLERDELSVNAGLMATARAATPSLAQLRLLFYVSEVFQPNWDYLYRGQNADKW